MTLDKATYIQLDLMEEKINNIENKLEQLNNQLQQFFQEILETEQIDNNEQTNNNQKLKITEKQ